LIGCAIGQLANPTLLSDMELNPLCHCAI
jgi:hypothetical protein